METIEHFWVLIFIVCLSGCVSSPPLYSWGDYEAQVYAYLNRGNLETQIRILERNRQEIEASGQITPPGFYAHLGMLYAELGNHEMSILYLEGEKARFPESTVFMNLLLSRYGR